LRFTICCLTEQLPRTVFVATDHPVRRQPGDVLGVTYFDQAEKDYVILWLLSGLAHSGAKKHGWVFKGGTCLRHCYYEGYRFSEDIDFSWRPGGDNLDTSIRLLDTVNAWVLQESGVRLSMRDPLTAPGDFQIEIPMEYNRGGARRQGLPQVKVHLTFDDPILDKAVDRSVTPGYPDLSPFGNTAYSNEVQKPLEIAAFFYGKMIAFLICGIN